GPRWQGTRSPGGAQARAGGRAGRSDKGDPPSRGPPGGAANREAPFESRDRRRPEPGSLSRTERGDRRVHDQAIALARRLRSFRPSRFPGGGPPLVRSLRLEIHFGRRGKILNRLAKSPRGPCRRTPREQAFLAEPFDRVAHGSFDRTVGHPELSNRLAVVHQGPGQEEIREPRRELRRGPSDMGPGFPRPRSEPQRPPADVPGRHGSPRDRARDSDEIARLAVLARAAV